MSEFQVTYDILKLIYLNEKIRKMRIFTLKDNNSLISLRYFNSFENFLANYKNIALNEKNYEKYKDYVEKMNYSLIIETFFMKCYENILN